MRQRVRSAWLFLIPMLLVLAAVAGWPLLRTIYFGFTNTSLADFENRQFVGFANYLSVLKMPSGRVIYDGLLVDPVWWRAVLNTVKFTVISVTLETIFGLVVALVLNAEFRGRGLVRAAILSLGDPDHRFGQDVGVDAQRSVRHHQRHPASPEPYRPQDRLDG